MAVHYTVLSTLYVFEDCRKNKKGKLSEQDSLVISYSQHPDSRSQPQMNTNLNFFLLMKIRCESSNVPVTPATFHYLFRHSFVLPKKNEGWMKICLLGIRNCKMTRGLAKSFFSSVLKSRWLCEVAWLSVKTHGQSNLLYYDVFPKQMKL